VSNKAREDNRRRMPEVAKIIDEMRAALGPELSAGMRLIYAIEGDLVIGNPDQAQGVRPSIPESMIVQAQSLINKKRVRGIGV